MSTDPDPSPQPSSNDNPQSEEHLDTKAQFRAALDRKRQQQSDRVNGGLGTPTPGSTHGAAGAKRVFRRKSG